MSEASFTIQKDYTAAEFDQLLAEAPPGLGRPARAEKICEILGGRPYRDNPLGGGPGQREAFTASIQTFDCVTFMETVTAFTRSATEEEFLDLLRHLRYADGRVDYFQRRHYMSGWLAGNEAAGRVRYLASDTPEKRWARVLTTLPALGPTAAEIRGWPKRRMARIRPEIQSGDLILFVSTRSVLDYFHTGVLLRRGGQLLLAQAARSRGTVGIIPLREFLRAERMSGITIARPSG